MHLFVPSIFHIHEGLLHELRKIECSAFTVEKGYLSCYISVGNSTA